MDNMKAVMSQERRALGRNGRADTIGEVRMALHGYKENSNPNSSVIPDLIREVTTSERSIWWHGLKSRSLH